MEISHTGTSLQPPAPTNNNNIRTLLQVLKDLAFPTHSQILSLKNSQERVLTKLSLGGKGDHEGTPIPARGTSIQWREALPVTSGNHSSVFLLLPPPPSHLAASQESHLLIADLPLPKWIPISQLTHSY